MQRFYQSKPSIKAVISTEGRNLLKCSDGANCISSGDISLRFASFDMTGRLGKLPAITMKHITKYKGCPYGNKLKQIGRQMQYGRGFPKLHCSRFVTDHSHQFILLHHSSDNENDNLPTGRQANDNKKNILEQAFPYKSLSCNHFWEGQYHKKKIHDKNGNKSYQHIKKSAMNNILLQF